MCFEGKWLQNQLRADKNESSSLLAVDIQGHQHGGFYIVTTKLIYTIIKIIQIVFVHVCPGVSCGSLQQHMEKIVALGL